MTTMPSTYAAGVRLPFRQLPREVVGWIEHHLGAPVVDHEDRQGGFSPGVAAVVTAADGRRGFVKAVGATVNPDAIGFLRAEADQATRLPDVPGLLRPIATGELVTGEAEEWCMALFPAIDGRPPPHPWRPDDVVRVLDRLGELANALTPSPWPPVPDRDGTFARFFTGWARIAEHGDDPWRTDPWVAAHLDRLVELERAVREGLPGDTLNHRDLRADNLLLTADTVWFVDWAHAGNAARWLDPLVLIADVVSSRADLGDGGTVDVPALLRTHPVLTVADEAVQWGVIAGLAATLHRFAQADAPPGLPTIRRWQDQTADDLLAFVRRALPAGR